MRISSFDIFDTCIVRKCGEPRNLFDVLSYRVFREEVAIEHRIEFITRRLAADDSATFEHLYDTFCYKHPLLWEKKCLMQMELECEREMMVPVSAMLKKVNQCRNNGDTIIFISDMYLPTAFLKSALSEFGFLKETDSIYVSGDWGHTKKEGTLYQLIKDKEQIDYVNWHHYGDNPVSDVQIPSKLGITTHAIQYSYLPYEKKWKDYGTNLTHHTGDIMAGIGRGISLSIADHPHNAFAIDIAAPLLATFATRIMCDAAKRGIKRLFFCSRDCYALFHVAKKLEKVISGVSVQYFYTSRKALYNSTEEDTISYLKHVGIAQNEERTGIVDMRSTGKSLCYINKLLEKFGFGSVYGYYFEMYCSNYFTDEMPPYYCEINRLYCGLLSHHHPIFETFLSLCPDRSTIGYKNNLPVFASQSKDDYAIDGIETLSRINLSIIEQYTNCFIETGLYRRSTEMFYMFIIPTIKNFFASPTKDYLLTLPNFYLLQDDGSYIPYVEKKKYNIAYYVALITKTSNIRVIRRFMKLIMRITHITPIRDNEWWPEGTEAYNNH